LQKSSNRWTSSRNGTAESTHLAVGQHRNIVRLQSKTGEKKMFLVPDVGTCLQKTVGQRAKTRGSDRLEEGGTAQAGGSTDEPVETIVPKGAPKSRTPTPHEVRKKIAGTSVPKRGGKKGVLVQISETVQS